MSPAQELLREDVKSKRYSDSETLWNSRSEYQVYELSYFRSRVRQEEKTLKFRNHLERERQEKLDKKKEENRKRIEAAEKKAEAAKKKAEADKEKKKQKKEAAAKKKAEADMATEVRIIQRYLAKTAIMNPGERNEPTSRKKHKK